MSGETNLELMLASLTVTRRPLTYTVVSVEAAEEPPAIGGGVAAVLVEREGVTVVCSVEAAERNGWPVDFEATWLTLDVHSSLEAVGLTAAFSAALSAASIPCNVLAGFFHDHLLVPAARADEAVQCLEALREPETAAGVSLGRVPAPVANITTTDLGPTS
jgi:hypothetical protein